MNSQHQQQRRRWADLSLPLFVALVVVAEIAFLGRLDFAVVENWTNSFYFPSPSSSITTTTTTTTTVDPSSSSIPSSFREVTVDDEVGEGRRCEEWLEREDAVAYSRDFRSDPVLVSGTEQDWSSCSVGCKFGFSADKVPDATFGIPQNPETAGVLRSMESSHYYAENNIDLARRCTLHDAPALAWWNSNMKRHDVSPALRKFLKVCFRSANGLWGKRWMEVAVMISAGGVEILKKNLYCGARRGYKIIMTTSLSSDVPVGYFSWAEYDIMAPVGPKTAGAFAAAFISNCGARNFRLQALEMLEKLEIKIDSYGSCHRNHDGNVDKVETLKRYKFSLAFENSNEEDYVTEKFFQSLVAGTVPVVVGAPNIQDFAPSPGSILHIKELADTVSVANTMKYLASNPDAYNKSLSWKYDGPSDSFKALVDMAAVHSSCRLCIHIATKIREKEEKTAKFQNRPCKCSSNRGTIYHLYVRERGRFEMESIYLRSWNLTLKALESVVLSKFKSLNHVPIWKKERPESIRGGDELKIYRIYPVGITERQALYIFKFNSDNDLKKHIQNNPCTKLEVIFV